MAYGSVVDPVGGTVITVSYFVTNALDPIRWLRLLTGNADPPGSSYVVVSDSTTGTTWRKIPTDAVADGAITTVKIANLGVTAAKSSAGAGTAGFILSTNGTDWVWANPAAFTVGAASNADKVDGADATATPGAAGVIPITNGAGKIANGFLTTGPLGGLDADTVDGSHANEFVKLNPGANQTIVGSDLTLSAGKLNATRNLPTDTVMTINNSGGGNSASFIGSVVITGSLTASGGKSRLATGHDDSQALFYANETPIPVFEDFGRARLVDGVAVVQIPPDVANYLSLDDYQVYLTAEGPARPYIAERTRERFVVRALPDEPDVSFVWRLMAVQGDMTHIERHLPFTEEPAA